MKCCKCWLCGKAFKSKLKFQESKIDREPESLSILEPEDSEEAKLIVNYTCKFCYENLDNIIMGIFIDELELYIANTSKLKTKILDIMKSEFEKIDDKSSKMLNLINKLKDKSILIIDDNLYNDIYNLGIPTIISKYFKHFKQDLLTRKYSSITH